MTLQKLIIGILVLIAFFSCSEAQKNINPNAFNYQEVQALKALSGKWKEEGENHIFNFEPFAEKKKINSADGEFKYFCGKATRTFYNSEKKLEEWKMYFYIKDSEKIIMYFIASDGGYDKNKMKRYDFVKDTFQLDICDATDMNNIIPYYPFFRYK